MHIGELDVTGDKNPKNGLTDCYHDISGGTHT
jgi:hypothetical protein